MATATNKTDFIAPLSEGSQVPNAVHLLPLGDVQGRDGRYWRLDDPQQVIKAFQRTSFDLPIDYEHQTEISQTNGQPAPAAGWIKRLELRPDGIWGAVEWTARARQMIAAKEYRFLSPVFTFNQHNRRIGVLQSAALTNVPNLHLTALARREDASMTSASSSSAITKALNLPETASEADIIAAIEATRNNPDPVAFMPVAQVKELLAELQQLKSKTTDEMALNRVDLAMSQGRLVPALRDWAVALCRQNPTAFDEFVEKSPLRLSEPVKFAELNSSALSHSLGEEDRAVCRILDISENDYRKNRDAAR